jgi:hypothetical protein
MAKRENEKGRLAMSMGRMRMRWACPAFGALILLLASCQRPETPPLEAPPDVTADEQQRSAACWQWASAQAEREFARVQPDPGAAYGRPIPLRDRFDRHDAEKRRQMLHRRCMAEGMPQGRP